MKLVAVKPARASVEDSGVPPPRDVTVSHDYIPVLHLPDGRVLVRKAGF